MGQHLARIASPPWATIEQMFCIVKPGCRGRGLNRSAGSRLGDQTGGRGSPERKRCEKHANGNEAETRDLR